MCNKNKSITLRKVAKELLSLLRFVNFALDWENHNPQQNIKNNKKDIPKLQKKKKKNSKFST